MARVMDICLGDGIGGKEMFDIGFKMAAFGFYFVFAADFGHVGSA